MGDGLGPYFSWFDLGKIQTDTWNILILPNIGITTTKIGGAVIEKQRCMCNA